MHQVSFGIREDAAGERPLLTRTICHCLPGKCRFLDLHSACSAINNATTTQRTDVHTVAGLASLSEGRRLGKPLRPLKPKRSSASPSGESVLCGADTYCDE